MNRPDPKRLVSGAVPALLACLVLASVAAGPALAAAANAQATQVDINKASVEQLVTIPGVGEATARRIVAFREEHGPFRRVEDLMKVRGIGEKSLEKLRPYVKVSGKN